MAKLPTVLVLTLALAACSGAGPLASGYPSTGGPLTAAPNSTPNAAAIGAIPGADILDRGPQVVADIPAEDMRALAGARNEFALDIFRILAASDGNVVLGPDSISNALSMTYAGAAGQTAAQMRKHMHLPLPDDQLHAAAGALDASLRSLDGMEGIEMLRGTRLFGQKDMQFGEPFLDTLSRDYGAPLAALDFAAQPEASRSVINDWVAALTNGLIKELMPQGTVDPSTRLVITDAQYMKAAWDEPFNPAETRDLPFELPNSQRVVVPTMLNDLKIPITGGSDWVAGELPYKGGRLALLVIVPRSLASFEQDLTADRLDGIIGQLAVDSYVPIQLPRFEVKQHSSLLPVLAQLGITDLTNLSGIAPGLFVGAVEHEAVVKVNEEGTEAAAATGVAIPASMPQFELKADRPFLFFVRDRQTGAILFMGRVADPSASTP